MLNVKAVILVGSRDFNRCPLASRLPTALWPVAGRPVLDRLLRHLADQGVRQVAVCSNGDGSILAESIRPDSRLNVTFEDAPLPVGTAGSLRCVGQDAADELLLVFSAGTVCPPDVNALIEAHRQGGSDLTVMLNPGTSDGSSDGQASGIYVCNASVLEHIPKAGYFDIKEGLIPEMLRAGKSVHAVTLARHAGNFRDRRGYRFAVANYLADGRNIDGSAGYRRDSAAGDVWIAEDANVDPGARLCGPVVVREGARIGRGAVVLGPAVLGSHTTVGAGSVIIDSILWEGARVGSNCEVRQSVIGRGASVPGGTVLEDESVVAKPAGLLDPVKSLWHTISVELPGRCEPLLRRLNARLPVEIPCDRKTLTVCFAAIAIVASFFWSYWSGIVELWNLWIRSDEYSSGLLVPFLGAYIVWSRRESLARCPIRPSLWGAFVFLGAQGGRLFGLFLMYGSAERGSLVLSIAAIVLLLFGWPLFKKLSTVLLFLCLMLPWPNIVQHHIGLHLQRWATSSAVFCLETVGYEVIQEGNIIHIGSASVEVAYACNGLRMITAFFVISGLVVLLVDRAWWEKLVILISSIPIALLCNTGRLTVTAVALTRLSGQFWDDVFHDFGGYAMMPLALAAVVGELWLLTKLTSVPQTEERIIIARQRG